MNSFIINSQSSLQEESEVNIIYGIDIGIKTFSIIAKSCDKQILSVTIDFSKTINKSKSSSSKSFSMIKSLMLIYDSFISIYKNRILIIGIEKQISLAKNNILIQTILETILTINNIKYVLIDPKSKYSNIKKEYNIRTIDKKQLNNYIDFDFSLSSKYTIKKNDLNFILEKEEKIDNKKLDDIIDSELIYRITYETFDSSKSLCSFTT